MQGKTKVQNYHVVLIGAGQLGSRYLQGLVKAQFKLNISVIDVSVSSLETAKARWAEVGGGQCAHHIEWLPSLTLNIKKIDMAIIATSAKGRSDIIKHLNSHYDIRFWIIEKVLAQSVSQIQNIQSTLQQAEGAWVNTARRMMGWHQKLKKLLYGKGPLQISYAANNWGLACNAVHFLDLISWWTNEIIVSIDTSHLEKDWYESKRVGYYEINGILQAQYSGGTTVSLNANSKINTNILRLKTSDGEVWEIDESNGSAIGPDGIRIDGKLEYQSELSHQLVDNIFMTGRCELPSLNESAEMHKIFIDAMQKHWNFCQGKKHEYVPIT